MFKRGYTEQVHWLTANIRSNQRATVAGWGMLENPPENPEEELRFPEILHSLEVSTVGRRKCASEFGIAVYDREDSIWAISRSNSGSGICVVTK